MIIIPIKWLFHWEYTLFSDKPKWDSYQPLSKQTHFLAPSTPWAAGQLESRPHRGPLQRSGSRPQRGHGGAMMGLKSTKKKYVTRCYTKITSICCCFFFFMFFCLSFFLQMLSPRLTTLTISLLLCKVQLQHRWQLELLHTLTIFTSPQLF